jgi:hypothetical protein
VDSPPEPGLAYAIPAGNPFADGPGADEIYAYGVRNPFTFSFDDGPGGDGRLYMPDVGQNLFEEVNIAVLGGNYGWVIREGFHCFDPFNPDMPPADCASTGPLGEPLLDPVVEYSHEEGGLSIIGGHVYRGDGSPSLVGTYVFGDWSSDFSTPLGRIFYLEETGPDAYVIREFQIGDEDRPYGLFLKGIGEGEDGELYLCGTTALAPMGDTGVVERLQVQGPVAARAAYLSVVEDREGILLAWELANFEQVDALQVLRRIDGREPAIVAAWTGPDAAERRSWIDRDTQAGRTYQYRIAAMSGGIEVASDEVDIERSLPAATRSELLGAAPNPFNPSTDISFRAAVPGRASLKILDARGRLVRTFEWDSIAAGEQTVRWDGRNNARRAVPSGVYLVHLETEGGGDFEAITLLK